MTNFKEGFFGKFEEEKRNLYLVYGDTQELIKTNVSFDEAFHEMNQYLDKVNFKSYYTRSWDASKGKDHRTIIDFGSHYKFFHWANEPYVQLEETKESKPSYETIKTELELDAAILNLLEDFRKDKVNLKDLII